MNARLDLTDQGDRVQALTSALIGGFEGLRAYPDADDVWRARYLGGNCAATLLHIALAIEAEARAAAVAPYVKALRACIAGFDEWDAERGRAPLPGIPERWWQASEAARRLLSTPPLHPSGEPEPGGLDVERREPTVEPSHFGDWIDFGPLAADTIIVAVNDGGGYQPVLWVKLPHQLYVADVEKLYAEHREVWVLPIRSSGWIAVPRILAATPERPAGEAGTDA